MDANIKSIIQDKLEKGSEKEDVLSSFDISLKEEELLNDTDY